MRNNNYYDAIWDIDHRHLTHLAPGLHSFINPDDMDELHDFFAMMLGFSI